MGGPLQTRLIPEPKRDLEPRRRALSALDAARSEIESFSESPAGESLEDEAAKESVEFDVVREVLLDEDQTLPNAKLHILQSQTEVLDRIVESKSTQLQAIPSIFRDVVESESLAHPAKSAAKALLALKPQVLLFSDDHRLLESEYNLEELFEGDNPPIIPSALNNLAGAAGLTLRTLYEAATIDDKGCIETLLDNANEKLGDLLKTSWSQSPINVRLRLDGRVIHVLVRSPGGQFDRIAERSDGLAPVPSTPHVPLQSARARCSADSLDR